jgi:hypothetical protein
MIIDGGAVVLDEEGGRISGCCSDRWAHPARKLAITAAYRWIQISFLIDKW